MNYKGTECLNRRYKELDNFIKELSVTSHKTISERPSNTSNVGIKLMCDFWNILKEDPDCNLTEEVQMRMGTGIRSESNCKMFYPRHYMAYMSDKSCCGGRDKQEKTPEIIVEDKATQPCCSGSKPVDQLMLSKVLCNLKEAAIFDKKCHERVKQLLRAQEELTEQIKKLEKKEKEGAELLKKADCMWMCMEESYKRKIKDSIDKQNSLLIPLKEVEDSCNKWRKNKKDLEFQIKNINKAKMEMTEKLNQKKNDIKLIETQIANFENRIESAKVDMENCHKVMANKKAASDGRIAKLAADISKIQKRTQDERKHLKNKEEEGKQYVKDARLDLQKICKVLLQKKIENEDLRAEKTALLGEMKILNTSVETCRDRCKNKKESVLAEIKKLNAEIAAFKLKCVKCHVCTDTNDVRKFCTDCPRCLDERDCKVADNCCSEDPEMDCVCMSVKQKFLDNIFDNMYTVLERQAKTRPGKAVATAILNSLKKSSNGKLCRETRELLQEFILTTVKRNLNLTIVGGAVKTRCEMDPDTYKDLMKCLKSVKVGKTSKEDKGTAKKDPCTQWGTSYECNCPKGPKDCICTKKGLKPAKPGTPIPQDPEDLGEVKTCPFKDKSQTCGIDCGAQGQAKSKDFSHDIESWRPSPCAGPSCPFGKHPKTAPALCDFSCGSRVKLQRSSCTCADVRLRGCHCARGTKLMKALRYCNRATTVDLWAKSHHDVRVSFTRAEHDFYKQDADAMKTVNKTQIYKRYSLQMDKLNSNSDADIERQPSKKMVSKQFKMSVGNTTSNSDSQFTRLAETKSGTLIMELDQRMVEAIERRIYDSPFVFISLKKTDSGHLVLDFDNDEDVVSDKQRVTLINTPSGTKHLEIHRSVLNLLKDTRKVSKESQSVIKTEPCYLLYDETEQSSVENTNNETNITLLKPSITKIQLKNDVRKCINPKCVSVQNICDLHTNNGIPISKSVALSACELLHDYSSELHQLFEKGNVVITLQIKNKSKLHDKIKAVMTKSPSGSIGAFLLQLESLQNIINNYNEYPVCLSKTKSNTYVVNVDQSDDAVSNGVLKKSASGVVMLTPTSPQLNMIKRGITCDTLFKIKVTGYKDYPIKLIKHAVLKPTQSNNFVIKFEEAFDNSIEETMQNYVGKERQCFVFLKKTFSGYVIDLNENGQIEPQKLNALLVINEWRSIKVLLHGHIFERIDSTKRSSISSAQVFGNLLYKVRPASSTEFHKINLKKSKQINEKTVSDSQLLYDRVKVNLQMSKTLLRSPSTVLEKTKSGNYAITLSKDSKKIFVNNLISFLAPNDTAVPPNGTKSGEIFKNLNNDSDVEEHRGTLKITSSGNFYIMVDSQSAVIMDTRNNKKVSKNELCETKSLSQVWPVDKAVTTNCNCLNDSDLRDLINWIDQSSCWNNSKKVSSETISIGNTGASGTLCTPCQHKIQNQKSVESPHLDHIQRDKSPCQHTIQSQKSVEGSYLDDNKAKSDKSEFYEMFNPTKLIRNGEFESNYSDELPQREKECWNSFDYLPPQLPPFLQNVYY